MVATRNICQVMHILRETIFMRNILHDRYLAAAESQSWAASIAPSPGGGNSQFYLFLYLTIGSIKSAETQKFI